MLLQSWKLDLVRPCPPLFRSFFGGQCFSHLMNSVFFWHEVCIWKGAGTSHGFDASLAWSQKECIATEDFTRVVAFPASPSQGDVGAVSCRSMTLGVEMITRVLIHCAFRSRSETFYYMCVIALLVLLGLRHAGCGCGS